MPSFIRREARRVTAVAMILAALAMAAPGGIADSDRRELATRFRFDSHPLRVAAADRTLRPVHPSLDRIAAWISAVGAGVALADLDGNGLADDLCLVDPRTDQVTVMPVPGAPARYQPLALEAPLPEGAGEAVAPMGCLPLDANEDGLLDLIVYYWGRPPVAFLRRAGGPLAPEGFLTRELAPFERWYTNALVAADLDGDGHVDLAVGNYFPDGSRILDRTAEGRESMQHSMSMAMNGGRNRFLLWTGGAGGSTPSVQFRDQPAGLTDEALRGWTLALGAADLDGDLLPELYVANDFGPDQLLHNRSRPGALLLAPVEGRRTLGVPKSKILGRDSFKGMGVDFGDLNGDGRLDLYVSNIATEYALHESHFAWVSTGPPGEFARGVAPYTDRSETLGLARGGWGWDARLADFDNDGVLEAVQATGFLRGTVNRWPELQELAMTNDELLANPHSWPRFRPGDDLSGHQHNPFRVRGPDGRYHDLAPDIGLGSPNVSRGLAVGDVNGDGLLDLAIANQWEDSELLVNRAPTPGAALVVDLRQPAAGVELDSVLVLPGPGPAPVPSRAAIGAQLRVTLPDGSLRVGQVDGGSGHSGKRSHHVHLGLGRHEGLGALPTEIRWRDDRGRAHRTRLALAPGWWTVILGGEAREVTP